MKAKEKALEYIKSRIPFSAGFHEGDMEDVVIKGIDMAIKETINDRDRIHNINLECARQGEKDKPINLDMMADILTQEVYTELGKLKHLVTDKIMESYINSLSIELIERGKEK